MKTFRLHQRLIWPILCCISLALTPAILDRPSYRLYLNANQWQVAASFFANEKPQRGDLPKLLLRSAEAKFWRNYPENGVKPGRICSAPFTLLNTRLFIPVYGFPISKYVETYVESELDHRRFPIQFGAAHGQWQPCVVTLPSSLVHTQVRLVADDSGMEGPSYMMGIGTPYYRTNSALPGLHFSKVFVATVVSLLYLVLLFFPFFSLAGCLISVQATEKLLLTLALTAIASLPLFFLAYYHPAIGRVVAYIWLISSAICLLRAIARSSGNLRRNSIYICLLILCGLTVFQSFFLFSFNATSTFYSANYLFHPAIWSTDNQIPPTTAHLLANGSVTTHWPFGSWTISDRTPLLTALLYPAAVVTHDISSRFSSASESMILQICGFGFLNSWIVAGWAILRRLRLKPEQCIAALLLLAATPFVFFNSVYIWPKLLAATFCLIQYFYLGTRIDHPWRNCRYGRAIISGIAAGLAIMSHSGTVLAVLAIFLIVALRSPARWLHLAIAGAMTGVLIFPWVIWTIAVPTSKALPKFFLMGSFGFSTPTEGVLHATLRTYRTMSLSQWFNLKLGALGTLSGWRHGDVRELVGQFGDPLAGLGAIRAYQFFYLLPSIGLLLVPLIWLFVAYARKRVMISGEKHAVFGDLINACLLTVFLQIVIMMPSHLLPLYPYFVPLTFQLLAVIGILASGSFILRMTGFLNYLLFIVFWLVSTVLTTPLASIGALLCAFVLVGLASFLVIKILFNENSSATSRTRIGAGE